MINEELYNKALLMESIYAARLEALTKIVKATPNDQELGELMRKLFLK